MADKQRTTSRTYEYNLQYLEKPRHQFELQNSFLSPQEPKQWLLFQCTDLTEEAWIYIS